MTSPLLPNSPSIIRLVATHENFTPFPQTCHLMSTSGSSSLSTYLHPLGRTQPSTPIPPHLTSALLWQLPATSDRFPPFHRCHSLPTLNSSRSPHSLPTNIRKERKESLTRGNVKNIASTMGIHSDRGQGYEEVMTGKCISNSRHLHLYVMAVLSGARVVRAI